MARQATKALNNVYYQARMEAAKYNEKLLTRAGASDVISCISEDSIKKYELGMTTPPSDAVVLMADAYNAPHLLNHYCLYECPIGRNMPISEESSGIEKVTLKLIKNLKVSELDSIKDKLVDIAEDGIISDDEKPDLKEVLDYLDRLSKTVSELRIIGAKALKGDGNG